MKCLRAFNDILKEIYGIVKEPKGNLKEIFEILNDSKGYHKENLRMS